MFRSLTAFGEGGRVKPRNLIRGHSTLAYPTIFSCGVVIMLITLAGPSRNSPSDGDRQRLPRPRPASRPLATAVWCRPIGKTIASLSWMLLHCIGTEEACLVAVIPGGYRYANRPSCELSLRSAHWDTTSPLIQGMHLGLRTNAMYHPTSQTLSNGPRNMYLLTRSQHIFFLLLPVGSSAVSPYGHWKKKKKKKGRSIANIHE